MPTSTFRTLVALGDSVAWGQGLLQEQKYYSLVAAALGIPSNAVRVLAHSGAEIGKDEADTADICHGEVPESLPTIFQMLDQVARLDPETLVLISGGINDVEIARILNPLTTSSDLQRRTDRFCGSHMKALLEAVSRRLSDAKSRIVVTNYFPILSKDSVDGAGVDALLSVWGIAVDVHLTVRLPGGPARALLLNQIIDQCLLFWERSTAALREAAGSVGSSQVLFVDAGFKPENALFAGRPWLWSPLERDPMEDARRGACVRCEKNPFKLPICLKASSGHPNLLGAAAYARAIGEALGT